MASLSKDKSGNRTIQFVAGDRKRCSIRLGKMPQKDANNIKTKVEALNAAAIALTSWDAETAAWVGKLEALLYDKLANVGLVPKKAAPEKSTLGAFLAAYIKGRTDVKPKTREHLQRAQRNLVEYFGAAKALTEISAGDADDFRLNLAQKLGPNTVRRICGRAKQFFRAAQRKRLIVDSPFADMKETNVKANKSREFFITREMAAKVLEACPDAQWRLLFALSRFGGLRCPSEHMQLRWVDVDWANNRLTIRSPKTEHHEGKGRRVIPIFPELRPYLEDAWALVEESVMALDPEERAKTFVITRYRHKNANLRTQFERIIERAGLSVWPKIFHNLRSTRETELAETFPMHVVCEWIGNSRRSRRSTTCR